MRYAANGGIRANGFGQGGAGLKSEKPDQFEQCRTLLSQCSQTLVVLDERLCLIAMHAETLSLRRGDLPRAQLIGRPLPVHAEDVERLRDMLALPESRLAECDFRLVPEDGEACWLRLRAFRTSARTSPARWEGLLEDIDDQRRQVDALRAAEERYRLAARAARDVIWDYELAQGLVWLSGAAADLFGYDVGERAVTPAWWCARIHTQDRRRVLSEWRKALAGTAQTWTAEYQFLRADGTYAAIFDQAHLLRGADGSVIRALGTKVDLTETLRADSRIRQAQGEFFHGSQKSAMNTVASTLAHELNQPLTAISNFLYASRHLLPQDGSPEIEKVSANIDAAIDSAQLAGEIIRNVREFFYHGEPRRISVDIARLVDGATTLSLVGADDRDLEHMIEIPADARHVLGDRIQIQQVLMNLIRNAAEAMRNSACKRLTIASRRAGAMIVVSVSDSGPGMSATDADRLFCAFASRKADGMGIGLAISRTIVEASGGNIWFEQASQGGASFQFSIPAAEVPMPPHVR